MKLMIYSDAEQLGGAETTLGHMLAQLDPSYEVAVVGVYEPAVEWLAGCRPGSRWRLIEPLTNRHDWRGFRQHRQLFATERPDIVQFNLGLASSCQWPMAVAATIPNLRMIAVENSPMAPWSAASRLLKPVTSARLSAHVAVGEKTARAIEADSLLPPYSVGTMYHGVENIEVRTVPRLHEGHEIGTIARLDPVKGVDVVIQAMTEVPEPTRLVVIGRGAERDRLIALTSELGLRDRIEFRDVPWTDNVRNHLASFDLFVLGSRIEGFPVTIMEAMVCGVPVVATDVGSVDEAVSNGVTGRIVPPEDPSALASAINELLHDDDARLAMSNAAADDGARRFTAAATARRYEDVYQRVMATRCPPITNSLAGLVRANVQRWKSR